MMEKADCRASTEAVWTKFLRGSIEILQPKSGPRFSIDSIIAAGFSHLREGENVLDLGTGTGIILAILGKRFHPGKMVGIEIQKELAGLAKETLLKNDFGFGEIIEGDIRDGSLLSDTDFDVVVSNPPYFETGEGRTNREENLQISRHRESFSLRDLFSSAVRHLKPEGRLIFIAPFSDKGKLLKGLGEFRLYPKMTRAVSDTKESAPKRLLVQAVKERISLIELPPLILREDDGQYTPEVKKMTGDVPFNETPSFFCDAMLFRLAKYLRFTGFDTAYLRGADDDRLVRECQRSSRTLISLDRGLIARFKKRKLEFIEPKSVNPKEQLKEILALYPFDEKKGKRCLLCNAKVTFIPKEKIVGHVPEYTFKTQKDFFICHSCGKLTWGGTHLARFKKDVLGKEMAGGEND